MIQLGPGNVEHRHCEPNEKSWCIAALSLFSESRQSSIPNRQSSKVLGGILILLVVLTGGAAFAQDATGNGSQPDKDQDRRAEALSKRLIRGESVEQDPMARIVAQMAEAELRLARSFDPGPATQALQQRIIDDLDAAVAAAIRRGGRGGSGGGLAGDQRRRPSEAVAGQGRDTSGRAASGTRGDAARAKGEPATAGLSGQFRESRRGWGHLPPRDRQEVIQGLGEQSLEKFRQWIERYYKALAEEDRE